MKWSRDDVETVGTSLAGYVDVGYARLVEVFGEPNEYDSYKTDAHWALRFEDGTIATIYNYKDGKNYLGEEGKAVADIRNWHIVDLLGDAEGEEELELHRKAQHCCQVVRPRLITALNQMIYELAKGKLELAQDKNVKQYKGV